MSRFNFHHYDNLMHTRQKMDPRKRQLELTGQEVVSLLFGAYNGDLSALTRLKCRIHNSNTCIFVSIFEPCALIKSNLCIMRSFRMKLSGTDMKLADYDGRTALHLAAAEGHLDCVRFLLEKCAVPHDPRDRCVLAVHFS